VEARWKAGLDYYPAIVIGVRAVRGFGVVDLQYSDGSNDKEWGVVEALVRPLKKRRAAVAERVGADAAPAPAAEEPVSGQADEAPALAIHEGNKCACEIRRVGATEWRRFASRADADGVFPGLTKQNIGKLINNTAGALAPLHIREQYEARNADDADNELPAHTGGKRPMACEIRRVGDKKWWRFASRTDAARAFPDLDTSSIAKLIDKKRLAPEHIRDNYEARNVVDGDDELAVAAHGPEDSDDDEDNAPTAAPRPNGELACEVRRVGDK